MERIIASLQEIADRKKIQILYACETGSRAWGFPSPDSDYDIRFIYRHEMDWYLSLQQKKDTIDCTLENELDITGWDLRKCLTLLKKSNVPLIERFQSPVEYFADQSFAAPFRELIVHYYSPIAVFYHHYSLASKFWQELKDQEIVKLKSCFYLVRSLLSCNWLIKERSVLPMHMEGLMTLIEPEDREYLRDLIQLKIGVDEKYLHQKEQYLHDWIVRCLETIEAGRHELGVNKSSYSKLNEFFLKTLYADFNDRLVEK